MSIYFKVCKHMIWVQAKNLKDGAYAIQAHRLLVSKMGYQDTHCLEESDKGKGFQISVSEHETIAELKSGIQYIKSIMEKEQPTEQDHAQAAEYQRINGNKSPTPLDREPLK